MPRINENDLKNHIKSKKFSKVYFLYGEEDYLKQTYINKIIEKATTSDFRTFNLHQLNGKDLDIDEASDCCQSLPMFDDFTVTVIHDLSYSKTDFAQNSKLIQLISDIPDSTILIFWQETVFFDSADKSIFPVLDLMNKYADVLCFGKKTTSDLIKLLTQGAKKRDCTLSSENARYLLNISGNDLNVLHNELEKLCFYVNKREITQKDIDTVSTKSVQAKIFDLTKSLVNGKFDVSFELLDSLFKLKTEPTLILGTIISGYVDMYRAKVAVSNGENALALKETFNYGKNDFRLTNGLRDASKLSILQLRHALEILAKADEQMKLNYEESRTRIILEELLVSLRVL